MSNFLRDIKISTKISVLVGLTVLSMASVVVLGLRHISAIGKGVTVAAEEDIPLLEAVSKITFHSLEQSIHLERAIQFGKRMAQDNAAKNKFEIERKNFLRHGRMIVREIEENRTLIERMSKTNKAPEIRDILLSVDYELRNIHKQQADYQFSAELAFNLLSQGKLAEAEPTIQKITEKTEEEEEEEEDYHFEQAASLKNFVSAVKNFVEKSIARLKRNQQAAMRTMLLFSVFILLFSLVFGILISHDIKKPLSMAVNTAQRITAGDRNVEVEVTSKDEIGQLLNTMNEMSYSIKGKEDALKQANMDLHTEITERKQAEKALEVSNRELRDFVYIASHDLREPLRKISSFGMLLEESLEGKLQGEDRESMEFMIDGANRMTQMINSLLEYSRIGTKEITYETVDLNEAIEQLEQLELAALLEETGGVIEVPQPLPEVQADTVQIRQLLQNLITNGIKYRREGIDPRILIRAVRKDSPGEQTAENAVRIEVQDNGIGIDEENNRRIFKMFKRLHSRDKYEGAGIGLSICQKIVDRHGGRIGVESKAGEGSTFWFTLPASKSLEQEQEKLISSLET